MMITPKCAFPTCHNGATLRHLFTGTSDGIRYRTQFEACDSHALSPDAMANWCRIYTADPARTAVTIERV